MTRSSSILVLICFLVICQWDNVQGRDSKTVCQNLGLYINCGDQIIRIGSSFYGRFSNAICASHPDHQVPSGGCSALSASRVTKDTCDGRHCCYMDDFRSIFVDPCFGTFKYFTTSWDCVTANSRTACEGTDLQISCTANKVIKVDFAFYGRREDRVCGVWSVPSRGCSSRIALYMVRSSCEDKTSCTVGAKNGNFGDPCSGTGKYLTVSWTCQ